VKTLSPLVFIGLLLAGPGHPQGGRRVAFTFDDLPAVRFSSVAEAGAITVKLVGHLRTLGIPAIGFVNEGKLHRAPESAAALTALLETWLDAGFELGNHTYSHIRLYDNPLEAVQADVVRGERDTRRLLAARGRTPRYFRHPTLNTGPDLQTREAFERFLTLHGYIVAPVTIDNDEYLYALAYDRSRARGDSGVLRRLRADYVRYMDETFGFYEALSDSLLGRQPAQILLLHANALNADVLPALAGMAAGRGYRFVSLEEALRDPAYGLPDRYVGPQGPSWLVRWALTRGLRPAEPPGIPAWVRDAVNASPSPPSRQSSPSSPARSR
jgi:peptidoglycan/xylan/chitin deacetylase (PgdA/CDA1 family)